jgi:hypothetical protein
MLQNTAYGFLRLPHGRRAAKHLPGNFLRFLRANRFSPAALQDALRALYYGAVRGKPGDLPGFQDFKERWHALTARAE